MPNVMQRIAPITHNFKDDGTIPNNPSLPFVLYRAGIDLVGSPDPEEIIEKTFAENGWGDMWRNGVYPYVHYHSMIHEAMAVARGRAKVRFGGDNGREIDIVIRRCRHFAGWHRTSAPYPKPGPCCYRSVSAERQIQPLSRQQGGSYRGARLDPEGAAARD